MIEHFCQHFNLILPEYSLPALWVKNNNAKYLITRVSKNTVSFVFEPMVYTTCLDTLFDEYTWLDGSPCGIEED